MESHVVDVFADVRCPFAHVGLVRFARRRDELGLDVVLRVRAWPLELINQRPLDAGLIAEEVDALRAQVAPELFAGFDVRQFPATSLPALALTSGAYAVDLRAGERMAFAVRAALFEEGRDIATPGVLLDIAQSVGIGLPQSDEQAAIRRDWADGVRRGVIGSPHFFVGSAGFFCPALDISHASGHFDIARTRERFDTFIESALAA